MTVEDAAPAHQLVSGGRVEHGITESTSPVDQSRGQGNSPGRLYLIAPEIRVPIAPEEGVRLTAWYRAQQALRKRTLSDWMRRTGVELHEPNPSLHSPHFGMLALAAWLERCGHDVTYADEESLRASGRWGAMLEEIAERASGVFVGGITVHYQQVRALLREIKKRTHAVVVAGGHHATYREAEALDAGADLVVRGEGEIAVESIAEQIASHRLRWNEVPGASFLAGGELIRNPVSRLIDMEQLPPFPYHLLDEEQRASRDIYVFPGRGCRYACTFCAEGRYWRGHRMLSPEAICSAIELHQRSTPFNVVYLYESSFGEDRDRTLAFCHEFARRLPGTYLRTLSRIDLLDPELIASMQEARVIEVLVGVESADETIRARSGKRLPNDELFDRLEQLKKAVPLVKTSWMVGLPGENPESARATVKMISEVHRRGLVVEASCRVATYYPGTACFEHPGQFGVHFTSNDWSRYHRRCRPAYELDTMSSDQIYAFYCEAVEAETAAIERRLCATEASA